MTDAIRARKVLRSAGERGMLALLSGAAGASVLCVTGILGFLVWFSLPLLQPGQLAAVLSWTWQPTSGRFGILPMAVGSLLLASSAMLLAYPLGLGLALFVNGLGPRALAKPLGALVRLMSGVPTVVYGLASVFLLVPLVRSCFTGTSGFSWLAAMLVLALLVLPTVTLVLDGQLRLLVPGLRLTAAALGLTPAQTLVRLALPQCGHGLKAAAALGFGRAIGDTLIALMLTGNAAQVPHSPLDSLRALTAHIGLVLATDSQSEAYGSLFACGLLLFGVSLAVNLGPQGLSRRPRTALSAHLGRPLPGLEALATGLAWTSAILVPAALATLLGFLLLRGLPTVSLALFFGDTPPLDALVRGAPVFDGLWPACLGTLWLVGLAALFAVPVGLAGGIHLAEFASGRAARLAAFCVDLLAGVPSILMGLFGFALILLLRRSFWPSANTCLLLSALCLALLVLPYLVSATRAALAGLPQELRLTCAALGLSRWQAVRRVLLPAARQGILGGVVLALGRAAEDTAVILLTGVVVGAGRPGALTDKFEALPFTIYYLAAEHQTPQELDLAFGAALTLLALTLALFALARRLGGSATESWRPGT